MKKRSIKDDLFLFIFLTIIIGLSFYFTFNSSKNLFLYYIKYTKTEAEIIDLRKEYKTHYTKNIRKEKVHYYYKIYYYDKEEKPYSYWLEIDKHYNIVDKILIGYNPMNPKEVLPTDKIFTNWLFFLYLDLYHYSWLFFIIFVL